MKEILIPICAAALLTAVYKALSPGGKQSAQIKLLAACFFAVTVIRAAAGAVGAWDIPELAFTDGSYNDYTVRITDTLKAETADALRRTIEERLSEEGLSPEKIYIDVHIADNGRISINEIRLVFAASTDSVRAERAAAAVRSITGGSVAVYAEVPGGSR